MAQHLKTAVLSGLKSAISYFAPSPARSVIPARGVRYFVPVVDIQALWGAMNSAKDGRRYRKHIVVRRAPEHNGLLQLYTYHFPTRWSQACQDNRALIYLAQRMAHALEHDTSMAGLEWRLRFFKHYFRVVKGGATPEPGLKPYSRFYQYTYVALYRELKAAKSAAQECQIRQNEPAQTTPPTADDLTFEPVISFRHPSTPALTFRRPWTPARRLVPDFRPSPELDRYPLSNELLFVPNDPPKD